MKRSEALLARDEFMVHFGPVFRDGPVCGSGSVKAIKLN